MEGLRERFAFCKSNGRPALITFVTAGYPSVEETPDILLAMQKGGADVIELGIPFTDPIADGPTIQKANDKALENGVTIRVALRMVSDARKKGLVIPILFMGYMNPIMRFGEEELADECRRVGVNGFIVVDLPPREADEFREICANAGLSYIPLVAPSTPDDRVKHVCEIADSFAYVVTRMGVTGTNGGLNPEIPQLLARIRHHAGDKHVNLAVGFGISTRQNFQAVEKIADGVVIGSKIINLLEETSAEARLTKLTKYCREVTGRELEGELADEGIDLESFRELNEKISLPIRSVPFEPNGSTNPAQTRFGDFGGQYIPEILTTCLEELEAGFEAIKADPSFWDELRSHYHYMNRPSSLHLAPDLTRHANGARIWLKREDLNHTGSHKINNALGQVLLAKRLGKKAVIAETGAGQHGVATATICAAFGMKCTIYMGAEDARRQALNVFRIRLLGAEVIPVEIGSKTLRDAVNEAFRAWIVDLKSTHYVIGSAIGPHPFPSIVKTFQSVIGSETKNQFATAHPDGKALPDAVVACVGGGSNAIGMFSAFIDTPSVRLFGVEGGGDGIDSPGDRHSATLTRGAVGVFHGVRTYVLQNDEGQIADTHSISAGLDYPGVGPELAALRDRGRAGVLVADNKDALRGFILLSRLEGIIPALESAHAVAAVVKVANQLGAGKDVVLCLSGRGDKDVETVADVLPTYLDSLDLAALG